MWLTLLLQPSWESYLPTTAKMIDVNKSEAYVPVGEAIALWHVGENDGRQAVIVRSQ